MARLTFHGHSTYSLHLADGTHIVIDPWFDGNPACSTGLDDLGEVDYIFCTHGHPDHFTDAIPLADKTGAKLVSTFEIASFAEFKGVTNVHPMHLGGGFDFPFGRVKMIPALHGGKVFGDETGAYTTCPGGFLFHVDGVRVYHSGDTALMTDMGLLAGYVDVALLCIGDNFTMGPEDAVRAVDLIEPQVVIPNHYNTFDLIRQDPVAFANAVGSMSRVDILESGAVYGL